MTFYVAVATERHVVVAIDDRSTELNEDGTDIRYTHAPKVWRVNEATVACGSGAMPFVTTWGTQHFPAALRGSVDLQRLTAGAARLEAALARDHRQLCEVASPHHDTSATILLAGVSRCGRPFLLLSCSPAFPVSILGAGARVTSRIRPEEERAAGVPTFMQGLADRQRSLDESQQVRLLSSELVGLIRRVAVVSKHVAPTGHLAVVGPDGVSLTPFADG